MGQLTSGKLECLSEERDAFLKICENRENYEMEPGHRTWTRGACNHGVWTQTGFLLVYLTLNKNFLWRLKWDVNGKAASFPPQKTVGVPSSSYGYAGHHIQALPA